MAIKKNLKRYIFIRISCLAFGMSLLLSYQGTQSFLHGLDVQIAWHMRTVAEQGSTTGHMLNQALGYDVESNWESLPEQVKRVFSKPPEQPRKLHKYFENWWYFAPPETGYFVMMVYNQKGEQRYISHVREFRKQPQIGANAVKKGFRIDPMIKIALWGLGAMLVFLAALYWTFRSLSKPARDLYRWASELKIETSKQPIPDFHYQELDDLAEIIRTSMANSGKALEREKEFLGYASHELRTPLTSLRSNVTLLDKIFPASTPRERAVRDRILRSSLAMKGITETLLWLNRNDQEPLPYTDVDIAETINNAVSELQFLLENKDVQVKVNTSSHVCSLPEAAFLIMVTNVIRNAFQHTDSGEVEIFQAGSELCVTNSLNSSRGLHGTGFGLGLKLIQKIAQRFNWELKIWKSDSVYKIVITLA